MRTNKILGYSTLAFALLLFNAVYDQHFSFIRTNTREKGVESTTLVKESWGLGRGPYSNLPQLALSK